MTNQREPKMTRQEVAAVARAAWLEQVQSRIDDYLFIGGEQMSAREAARRVGVCERTITRYRRTLREAS